MGKLRLIFVLLILVGTFERASMAQILGTQSVFSTQGNVRATTPDAFPVAASIAMQVQYVSVYVDAANAATGLTVGIYNSNSTQTHPNKLLASGSVSALAPGWVQVKLTSAATIAAGSTYWITVLGAGSNFYYRVNSGTTCKNETYSARQATLPATWRTGSTLSGCPLSAYGSAASVVAGADLQAPSAPAGLAAPVSSGTVQLSWTASTDNVGVVLYNVYRSATSGFTPGASTLVLQTPGTTYNDAALPLGTYYYKVTAKDAAGNVSQPSSQATAVIPDTQPPSQPGTLSAKGAIGSATLAWGAATDNKAVVLYDVYRSTVSGFAPVPANLISQAVATGYVDNPPAGAYFYLVAAQDAAGNIGAVSNEASAVVSADTASPSAPGSLAATVNQTTVALSWAAATDNVGVVKYDVYRSTTAGFVPSSANRIAQPTGLIYSDTNLAPGTYYYLVAAEDAAANVGPPAGPATAVVAIQPIAILGSKTVFTKQDFVQASLPNAFQVVAATSFQAQFLSVYVDTPTTATSLKVALYSSDSTKTHPSALLASGSIAKVASGWVEAQLTTTASIQAGAKYWIAVIGSGGNFYYRLDASAPCTNETYSSSQTSFPTAWKTGGTFTGCPLSAFATAVSTATAGLDLQPPTAPATLAASISNGSVVLTWTASTDNVGVAMYNVYRSTTAGFTPGASTLVGLAASPGFTDSGLGLGTYYYLVTAQDAGGNVSPASNQATAVVSDTQPPSQPGTLTGSASVGAVALLWGAASDNIGVVRYNVYQSTTSGTPPSPSTLVGSSPTLGYTAAGVASGTYYYVVTALDAGGNVGPASNEVSVTVVGDTTPPSAPGTLNATINLTNVGLSWSTATDDVAVVKYDVYRSTVSGFVPDLTNRIGQTSALSYTDSNLIVGTYYYLVAAEDAAGNVGQSTNQVSAVIVAPLDTQAPTAAAKLAATRVSGNISLGWTAATDNIGVVAYNVYRSPVSGFAASVATQIGQASGTSFIDISPAPGNYYYLVAAQDASGNVGPASNEAYGVAGGGTAGGSGWILTFADEFNGATLDTNTWAPNYDPSLVKQVPDPYNNNSGEIECYAPEQVTESGGQLHLTALRVNYLCKDGLSYSYVSGMVQNYKVFSQLYGYWEVRMRIPKGNGLWPAFWTQPTQNLWPPEIDIAEILGNAPTKDYFTMHWGTYPTNNTDGSNWVGPDFSAGFHTFAVDWEPGKVVWYVDGVARYTSTNPSGVPTIPMYPILNLAVGGWPGNPDATTPFPANMDVDYIRIYQKVPSGSCYQTIPLPTDATPANVCP